MHWISVRFYEMGDTYMRIQILHKTKPYILTFYYYFIHLHQFQLQQLIIYSLCHENGSLAVYTLLITTAYLWVSTQVAGGTVFRKHIVLYFEASICSAADATFSPSLSTWNPTSPSLHTTKIKCRAKLSGHDGVFKDLPLQTRWPNHVWRGKCLNTMSVFG